MFNEFICFMAHLHQTRDEYEWRESSMGNWSIVVCETVLNWFSNQNWTIPGEKMNWRFERTKTKGQGIINNLMVGSLSDFMV